MPTSTKVKEITSPAPSKEKSPVKQAKKQVERRPDGTLMPGSTANPNGRPPAGKSIIEQFRDHPGAQDIINKLFKVASTIDEAKPHKDSMAAAKAIFGALVPSLKATELKVGEVDDKGFVFLPSEEEPDSE